MTVRSDVSSRFKVIASGKVSISTVTTTNVDFGTPDDINLAANPNYRPGDRILVIIDASTAGTTDTTSFSIQDAPDNAGSIGAPATAVTDGSLAGGTGDQYAVVGVRLQPNRPWLRFRAVRASGTTDTTVVQVTVLSVPQAGL